MDSMNNFWSAFISFYHAHFRCHDICGWVGREGQRVGTVGVVCPVGTGGKREYAEGSDYRLTSRVILNFLWRRVK